MPRESLGRRTRMHRHGVDPAILGQTGNRQGLRARSIPAGTDFDGQRNGDRPTDGGDDPLRQGGIPHECRTRMTLQDFLHRTAEIDIEDVGTGGLNDARRIGHDLRIGTEDLHRERFFGRHAVQQLNGLGRIIDQPVGADHLGADQPAAGTLGQQAHGQVGDSGQGRKHGQITGIDMADLHAGPFPSPAGLA
ncbi:hypothetical protein DESC_710029 [Desulfosarcina cetonica]|nr:hypothetical protein DESC_710029 [Desulfosarcina cetonica]